MECLMEPKNGHLKTPPSVRGRDLKILVVGDRHCGKTRFIQAFAGRQGNNAGEVAEVEYMTMYQCRYDFETESRDVKIFEVPNCRIDGIYDITKRQFDANGFVFMYAIDDPFGFENIEDKWFNCLKMNDCWNTEPAILVGNKRDLREDEQVIQRLDRQHRTPVTEQAGEEFAAQHADKIQRFYECSSLDENDQNIHDAFHFLLNKALRDWIISEGGNPDA